MYFLIRLLKLIFLGVVAYLLYKFLWKGEKIGFFKSRDKGRAQPHPQKALEEMKKDPVCGTYIPENQAITGKFGKETVYFCSEECKKSFRESSCA